jgi:hypothetical protein
MLFLVIICAGKDTTYEELILVWPFDGEKGEWEKEHVLNGEINSRT